MLSGQSYFFKSAFCLLDNDNSDYIFCISDSLGSVGLEDRMAGVGIFWIDQLLSEKVRKSVVLIYPLIHEQF